MASAARSISRSSPLRRMAANLAAESRSTATSRPSIRLRPTRSPSSAAARFLRSPVELSSCVESLLPMHSATASALMTSMLSLSRRGYGLLAEAGNDDM